MSGLVLYAKLTPNSAEAREHGTYPRLLHYDLQKGMAPQSIDAIAVINGRSVDVRVTLEVFPVVGVTNWQQTEGITDSQLLEQSKTVLASALRLDRTVALRGRTEVKYSDIDLARLIKHWRDRGYWPAELIFKVTAEPIPGETSVSNNVMELRLPVKAPN